MKQSKKNRKREACPAGGSSDYELAEQMGISHARVGQLRQRAYEKLRSAVLEDPELKEAAAELFGVAVEDLR